MRWLTFFLLCLVHVPISALAESPAPTVHWGGLAYPDQFPVLTAGFTMNRFTELDNPSRGTVPYGSTVRESFGLNQISFSWTHFSRSFTGWSTNLTAGIGPTSEQPSKFFQNSVIHPVMGLGPVPVGKTREDTDAMVDGSLTKWWGGRDDRAFFAGTGFSVGTLYQEVFGRAGFRRLSLSEDSNPPVRFSFMGRYSGLFSGSLLHYEEMPRQSVVWQASIGFGPYKQRQASPPPWEFEFGVTWDSGIFINELGQSRKEKFITFAATYEALKFETWNDLINDKDRGPTYGATLTLDLFRYAANDYRLFPDW
jgi:hypothetical protein